MLRRVTFLMLACAGAVSGPLHGQTASTKRGDVNVDGQITAHDALSVLSSVVGKSLPPEYRVLPNGDADGNGEVTAVDALVILGYVVGKSAGDHPIGKPLYSVSVTPGEAELTVGGTLKLDASVEGGTSGVSWRSGSPHVAGVDAAGLVTAVSEGSATVTAVLLADTTQRAEMVIRILPAVVHVDAPKAPPATPAPSPTTPGPSPTAPVPSPTAPVPSPTAPIPAPTAPVPAPTAPVPAPTAPVPAPTAPVPSPTPPVPTPATPVPAAPAPGPVATVTVSPSALALRVGQTGALSTVLKDGSANVLTDRSVAWSSSNAAVATVSSTGVVTAVASGTATVTGTSEGKSAAVTVQVSPPASAPVATVTISPTALALDVGQTGTLSTILKDVSANVLTDRSVAWSSSNAAVATVSSTGIVTAVAGGSATITASTEGKSASVGVVVSIVEITAASVVVSPASHAFTALAAHVQASAVTKNQQGQPITGRTVTWSSSNPAIAEVDQAGKVTARGNGTATVSATADGKSATVSVTVQQAAGSMQVSPLTTTLLALDASVQLSAAVKDANNYAVTGCTVAWASLSPGVATVSSTGSVVAKADGTALITASCGAASGTASVEVRLPVATPGTYAIPTSITADCSVDVTAALHSWIASVPDHSKLVFGNNACYNIDAGLKINDRNGLVFEGNGSTFRRISRGVSQQSNFSFQGGSDLTIRNMIIRGANPNAGLATAAYVVEIENQHGIHLASMQGAVIEDVQIYDVYGDFAALTHDYRLLGSQFPGLPNRNVVIRRGRFERNGRMGFGLTHVDGFALEDSYVSDVRWSAIDLELDDDRAMGLNIRVERNRFGPVMHSVFVSKGKGLSNMLGNVTIRGNTMEAQSSTCVPAITMRSRYAGSPWIGWVIENNLLRPRFQGLAIELTRAKDVVVHNNTIITGSVGGCGLEAPMRFVSSQGGRVTDNKVTGPWPVTHTVDSASSGFVVSGNVFQ